MINKEQTSDNKLTHITARNQLEYLHSVNDSLAVPILADTRLCLMIAVCGEVVYFFSSLTTSLPSYSTVMQWILGLLELNG